MQKLKPSISYVLLPAMLFFSMAQGQNTGDVINHLNDTLSTATISEAPVNAEQVNSKKDISMHFEFRSLPLNTINEQTFVAPDHQEGAVKKVQSKNGDTSILIDGRTVSGTRYDAADSSISPSQDLPQFTEFINGTYNYPAKPRSQWEAGVTAGLFTISGDVSTQPGLGYGIHLRKAIGYIASARLSYMEGTGYGLNWQNSRGYRLNRAWAGRYSGPVFYNYKTKVRDLSLEGIFTLNNIRFHKSKSGVNLYALAGVGILAYNTQVNALNDQGNSITNPFDSTLRYNFSGITAGRYKTRKSTKKALKDLLDDTYETRAETQGSRRPVLGSSTLRPVSHLGFGITFKLNNNFNLALEDRVTITKDDLLDGQQWSEQGGPTPVMTRDVDSYNYLTLGLNMNLGRKATEPLWWLNPLDYAYSEIRNPRLMRLPEPVFPDADGDGVTDQFDQEQTPAGVPVDTHGVSRDSDNDGLPDALDKEIITPTYCQPVDADGVGKCPCPEGCDIKTKKRNTNCATALGALPSIRFKENSARISTDARSSLISVAARLRYNPECRIVITSYGVSNKAAQRRGWNRVNAVINYLIEREGIPEDRFVLQPGQEGGNANTVDLRAASAED